MICPHPAIAELAGGVCPICPTLPRRPRSDRRAIERELLRRSFLDFAREAFPHMTGAPLRPNHATNGVIATLQAIADGHLSRVLIEIGPGLAKSTLLTLYAAWRLARDAAHRAIHASHAFDLAARDSRRARRLVESEWFRSRFGVELRDDESTVAQWATTRDGRYIAVGVGGSLTGHRALECVVDDALNAIDAHSKAKRDECHTWFAEGLSTRIDGDGPIVVCGQRLGIDDLIGRLKESPTWTAITLPAEFDSRRRCVVLGRDGRELWHDPREADGELAAPDVLTREKLDELKTSIGSAAYQSQFNQAPSSDENSMAPARWWRFYRQPHAPTGVRRPIGCDEGPAAELPDAFDRVVISADLTFGSAKGDYSVVQAWGATGGGRYLLEQFRRRCGFEEQVAAIKAIAAKYPGAKIVIEKAANGAAVIETLAKEIPGVVAQVPVGGKAQRLASVVPTIESASCYLPESAAWVADLVEEFQTFPGRHDDMVDAAVWALIELQGSGFSVEDHLRAWT